MMTKLLPNANRSREPTAKQLTTDILVGPILPVMLRLALPTIAVLVVQALVGVVETYFVSSLGADVLAGVAVVFPVLMLMQMMANGAIGGGLSSAISRASGAGRWQDAQALVWHGVIIAGVLGAAFAAIILIGGEALYHVMGVKGPSLSAALAYSNLVFAGAPLVWLVALLSAALRGAGDTKTPARITVLGGVILLPLSPVLILGWGPIPSFGVAGAGIAILLYYLFATLLLVRHMRSANSVIRLSIAPLSSRLFKDVLGVGFLSAIGTVQINLTVTVVTAVVGLFGPDAIAGYGIASRLDYLQIPLLFGLGTAIMTMVGVNIGAGQKQRAQRIAWVGAAVAFTFTELIGLGAAVYPRLWLSLFSDDHVILAAGTRYLQNVAPFYGAIGIGMALYFAGQGAKRVLWPVLAGTVRMAIAAFVGWLAVTQYGADLPSLFQIVALSALIYGVITVAASFVIGRSNPLAISGRT
ncbi:MATE family efflux transporter [Dickeya dianthicola]|uniref:MATE family efflux transporter n=2 Tax=Dickeya dianthicola TaxID=204039 RepID=A0ABX9NRT6_9GAMM|nr:MATE family efflux transporter [Dickeya dianthicola]MCI4070342.1 MATE family efflux transporter [Dickeya dianthicola]MCI4115840.1 MATE family efflux transporter [Dickeya dianthicola]MCI4118131.1 MATE family efflux transporter [Dickeya dianthicola]MCI4124096.1 MATE family efflux transporter [Dickeya dianthicola]MCI4190797.1 MATE family efflux transporter [Dickeya dianthicola]